MKLRKEDPIGFLHDCFKADRQSTTVWNIFSKSIRFCHVIDGQERLICDSHADFVALPTDKGESLAKLVSDFAGEEDLVYGSFFVRGCTLGPDGRANTLCAPLFFHPAQVAEEDELWTLRIDPGLRTLNAPLLHLLSGGHEAYLQLNREIGSQPIEQSQLGLLQEILTETLPEVDTSDLVLFPELPTLAELKAHPRKTEVLRISPSAATFLAPRSRSTLGTLNELQALRSPTIGSSALQAILGPACEVPERQRRPAPVPVNLSTRQQEVLRLAANESLSVVVGPPGTGKSFTIACVALEHMSRGETVLVVSQKDQAVNVVFDKIAQIYGSDAGVVRAGRSQHLKSLKRRIDGLLSGFQGGSFNTQEMKQVEAELKVVRRNMREAERALHKRHKWEIRWGTRLAEYWDASKGRRLPAAVKHRLVKYQSKRQSPHRDLIRTWLLYQGRYEDLAKQRIALQSKKKTRRLLYKHRNHLVLFNQAIRARRLSRQLELFQQLDVSKLLDAFPVWLVNASDLYEVLPLQRELFDLVIIDEASQCDMASILPALQRGKRAMIVGDPKQLRHISFLAVDKQRHFARAHGLTPDTREQLDYRNTSILDLAQARISSQQQSCLLNEHYRSHPAIIQFSNEQFYFGELEIMTHRLTHESSRPISVHRLTNKQAVMQQRRNRGEGQRIISDIQKTVAMFRGISTDTCPSIGVCSPFRNQVEWIHKRLLDVLKKGDFERFQILVGTPHRFQGEERDIVYTSWVLDQQAHPNSWRFVNQPELFNVMITRARIEQRIYISVAPKDMPAGHLLASLVQSTQTALSKPQAAEAAWLLKKVQDCLENMADIHIHRAYPIGSMVVDLLVVARDATYAIDLIGFPDETLMPLTISEVRRLDRIGIGVIPASYAEWVFDRARSEEELLGALFD